MSAPTIYRFPIEITDCQIIEAPGLGRFLTIEDRRGKPELWAEVNPDAPSIKRRVWVVGTGNPIPHEVRASDAEYVGHFLAADGRFVGHIYAAKFPERDEQ